MSIVASDIQKSCTRATPPSYILRFGYFCLKRRSTFGWFFWVGGTKPDLNAAYFLLLSPPITFSALIWSSYAFFNDPALVMHSPIAQGIICGIIFFWWTLVSPTLASFFFMHLLFFCFCYRLPQSSVRLNFSSFSLIFTPILAVEFPTIQWKGPVAICEKHVVREFPVQADWKWWKVSEGSSEGHLFTIFVENMGTQI